MNALPRYILFVALLFAVTLPSAFANGEGDTIKRSFTVSPGGTLFLDIDRGFVLVESGNDSMVHVEMDRIIDSSDADEIKRVMAMHRWDMEQDGDDVNVHSRFGRDEDGWSLMRRKSGVKLKVTVIVPRTYNVEFSTGAGNVVLRDLNGYVEGRTGAGNIEVGSIRGDVEIRSGSGNITIDRVDGSLEVSSGAGNLTVGEVTGEIQANTGAGNITARLVRQPTDESRLESGAGNVTVYLSDDVGVDVDARASVGSADCEFGLAVKGKWMSKSFGGRVNGGGPALTLRSGVGNVALLKALISVD